VGTGFRRYSGIWSNARATAAVFITEDPRAARQLLGEKEVFREIEARASEEYFGRARTDRAETIEMIKLLLTSWAI
jgi:Na+/phosphate symporter